MKVIDNIEQKLNCNVEDISNKIDLLIDTSKQNSILEKKFNKFKLIVYSSLQNHIFLLMIK